MTRLLVLILLLGLAHAETLRVAAAANLSPALPEVVAAFERAYPGVQVGITYGASGQLAEQVRLGAPFHIFLSASPVYVEHLVQEGKVLEQRSFARGRLVLFLPRRLGPAPEGLEALTRPGIRRIVLANPEHAPYGVAALAALKRSGLYPRVASRLIFAANVGQAAQMALQGADAGLISLAAALHPTLRSRGSYWLVPQTLHPPLLQVAALLEDDAGARRFLSFLTSDEAAVIWRRHGLERP